MLINYQIQEKREESTIIYSKYMEVP